MSRSQCRSYAWLYRALDSAHQAGGDDRCPNVLFIEVADANHAVIGALTVQVAAHSLTGDQLDHELLCLLPDRLVELRRRDTVKAYRHAADFDSVAIVDVGNIAGEGCLCCGGRGQQDKQEQNECVFHGGAVDVDVLDSPVHGAQTMQPR